MKQPGHYRNEVPVEFLDSFTKRRDRNCTTVLGHLKTGCLLSLQHQETISVNIPGGRGNQLSNYEGYPTQVERRQIRLRQTREHVKLLFTHGSIQPTVLQTAPTEHFMLSALLKRTPGILY